MTLANRLVGDWSRPAGSGSFAPRRSWAPEVPARQVDPTPGWL